MNRRRFFSTLIAASAAAPALAQQGPPPGPQKIDRLRLDAAESIFGVDFTEAEEQMALGSVNRNLDSYEQLRKLNVPVGTEPALIFHPYLPGKQPTGKASRNAKLRVSKPVVPTGLSPEEIAFLPVTSLAVLIESKRITSTELTKMYLESPEEIRRHAQMRGVAHRRPRPASRRRDADARNQGRQVSRAAAWDSLGREGSARHQGLSRRRGARRLTRIK